MVLSRFSKLSSVKILTSFILKALKGTVEIESSPRIERLDIINSVFTL